MPESVLVEHTPIVADNQGIVTSDSVLALHNPIIGDNAGIRTLDSVLFGAITAGGPAPDPVVYHMAVWNTTNGNWVRWTVNDAPDPGGASYPGPGTFGVDTQATATVEFID